MTSIADALRAGRSATGAAPGNGRGGHSNSGFNSSSNSDALSPGGHEWTAGSVIRALTSGNLVSLERLAAWSSRGELRDLEEEGGWSAAPFYAAAVHALREAWRAHDRAVLGSVGDDAHQTFLYDEKHGALQHNGASSSASGSGASSDGLRHTRMESGVDDEEDELGDGAARASDGLLAQEAWRRLQACYTFVARMLGVPELQPSVAGRRGGFDANFAAALVQRFEPKFRKQGNLTSMSAAQVHQANLTAVTGVGGVAMGSTGGAGAGAASSRAGSASRGVSAVAPVGLGVKSPEPDSPQPAELSLLRGLLHSLYSTFPPLRPTLRNLIGNFLQRYLRAPSHPQGVSEILQMYAAIIRGVGVPLAAQHRDFLLRHLLPLHQPHAMLNELAPVMQAYHESLVYVLVQFLEKDKEAAAMPQYQQQYYQQQSLCEQILTRLLHGWPNARAANSPKEVLLLHECEKILEFCPTDAPTPASSSGSPSSPPPSAAFHRIMAQFLPYLVQCISSYNHRVAERALQLWQNDRFVSLCQSDRAHILPAILPALLDEKRHWNGSVNKLRAVVLGLWRDMDVVLFTTVAHQHFLAADAAAAAAAATAAVSSQPAGVVPNVAPSSATPADSLARADKLIASLRPAEEANAAPTAESLALARQVRVASSLPPRVKYSDFVFGHLLGEGSFAQVRYAKWIQRGQLPSAWPEFAIKILSKELVAAQHYEANLAREIRIMHRLAHENINRLVGLCENATNTYLVLEYAPKGDLHSLIASLGSLDVPSARFVAAEVLRALEEIHRNEIVYVDLKPENVLVHSSGHIKLGDFGSSRFFDEVGAEGTDEGAPAKPDRLEGTADYLAPELLREQFAISPASDLWAFACTLYQMLAGRTPIWAEELAALPVADAKGNDGSGGGSSAGGANGASDGSGDSSMSDEERSAAHDAAMAAHEAAQKSHLLKKMVQFESGLGEDRYPDGFDPAARALIDAIMLPDPAQRIGVRRRTDAQGHPLQRGVAWTIDYAQLRAHPFFTGVDWVALPTLPAPNLTVGSVAPAPKDAQWARRKNSIMWAPMPRSYTFAEGAIVMPTIREDLAAEAATGSNVQRGLGGASGSLRAQMFAGKSGALGAPRFASLKESAQEGDESAAASMQLTEGDEEGEDDEDEEDVSSDEDSQMNGEGGVTTVSFRPGGSSELFNRMRAAPLPTSSGGSSSSGLPPRPQGKASSRASGPMAVVEAPREEDEWQFATGNSVGHGPPVAGVGAATSLSAGGSTHAVLPPRQPLGLHGHTHGTGMLPPSGAARGSGSFVPLADATAGPRGLGMGLRGPGPRQMGGGATASALLARVLGKPATGSAGAQMHMHPMAPLPEGSASASLPPHPPQQPPQP